MAILHNSEKFWNFLVNGRGLDIKKIFILEQGL